MINKILIIANEFPPIGGSGVQRTTNLVKHLPNYDITPYVITKEYTHGLYDDSLLKNIPDSVKIYRFKSFDFLNRKGFFGKILRFLATRFFIPDGEIFWYLKNKNKVLDILKKEDIKYIYSTSYPYSDHLLARFLKSKLKDIKWVTDFRDEWTNNPYFTQKLHMKLRYLIEKPMEKDIVEKCDYLIANTPFMLENFIKDTPSKKEKSTFIPNGYNDLDFKNYKVQNKNNDVFKMTYMGALYGKRKPDYFLQALKELIEEGHIKEDKIQMEYIGNYHEHLMNELKERFNLQKVMKITPYMKHDALLEYMSHSNLLVLIESEKNFYTGKIFEYIKMDIPIIATVPTDGAAASVVYQTNTGDVADFEDVKTIKQSILKYYNLWKNKEFKLYSNKEQIEKFSWNYHTKSIINCFEKI